MLNAICVCMFRDTWWFFGWNTHTESLSNFWNDITAIKLAFNLKNLSIDVDEYNLIVSNFKILGISMNNVYL